MLGKNRILKTLGNVPKRIPFAFSENTTYGCGGYADVAYYPKSFRQAYAVFDYLTSDNINFVVLGNGSNVLAADGRFCGAVICTKNLKGVFRTGERTLFCRAGTSVSALLRYCQNNGFGGLEFLAGIPATIGGLLYMNGGAANKFIGDRTASVKLYDGKLRILDNESCNFGYKYSTMRDINSLILGAELVFDISDGEKVRKETEKFLAARSAQPKGRSCGCVFKNTPSVSAGKLIDEVGLKGLSKGRARVSDEHANFIINGGACSRDVYGLISEVKRRVLEERGIALEEEVVYIGEFNDTDS